MRNKKLIIVVAACVVGGLAAAGVATAVFRAAGTPSAAPDLSSSTGDRMVVARFAHVAGSGDHVVVLQRTRDGYVCVWDAPDDSADKGGGGCNPAADPLGGRKLFVNLTYDGGPDASTVHDARLSGLVSSEVSAVDVVMTDGSTRRVAITHTNTRALAGADYGAFAYRVRQPEVRAGVTPVAVLARDSSGAVIDRQTTGIG
jgi:hypothetical protein